MQRPNPTSTSTDNSIWSSLDKPRSAIELKTTNAFVLAFRDGNRVYSALMAPGAITASALMTIGHPLQGLVNGTILVIQLDPIGGLRTYAAGIIHMIPSVVNVMRVFFTAVIGLLIPGIYSGMEVYVSLEKQQKKLQNEVKELQKNRQKLKQSLHNILPTIVSELIKSPKGVVKGTNTTLATNIGQLSKKLDTLNTQVSDTTTLNTLKEENKQLQKQLTAAEKERDDLKNKQLLELALTKQDLNSYKLANENLQKELISLKEQETQLRTQILQPLLELKQNASNAQVLQEQLKSIQKEIETIKHNHVEMNQQNLETQEVQYKELNSNDSKSLVLFHPDSTNEIAGPTSNSIRIDLSQTTVKKLCQNLINAQLEQQFFSQIFKNNSSVPTSLFDLLQNHTIPRAIFLPENRKSNPELTVTPPLKLPPSSIKKSVELTQTPNSPHPSPKANAAQGISTPSSRQGNARTTQAAQLQAINQQHEEQKNETQKKRQELAQRRKQLEQRKKENLTDELNSQNNETKNLPNN